MRTRFRKPFCVLVASWAVTGAAAPLERPAATRDAEIVSASGEAWVQFVATPDWIGAEREQILTAGDGLRTGDFGRLGVLFIDGVQIKLSRRTTLVVKQVARPGSAEPTALGLERGEIWSRAKTAPGAVRVDTPSATAAIRGTDWDIAVDERGTSTLTVVRGSVEFFNAAGRLLVGQGEQAVAEVGKAPVRMFLVQPAERVQWVFSFPLDVPGAISFRFHERARAATALPAARERLALAPAEGAAKLDLAGLLYDLKRDDESRRLFDELLAAEPSATRALVFRGLLALRGGDVAEAERFTNRALAAGSASDTEAQLARAAVFAARGQLAEAVTIVDQASARTDAPAVAGVVGAGFQAFIGQFSDAAVTAARFGTRFPEDERFPTLLAAMRMVLDDNAGAEDAARQALAINPDSASALALLGEIHHLEGRGDAAEDAYRRALAADETNVLAHNGIALVLAERGFFREAAAALEQALALAPGASILHANRGFLATIVEDLASARTSFSRALERDPGQHLALTGEALVALKEGRPAEAADAALRASLLEPRLSRPHNMAAIACFQQGKTDRALQELDLAAQLDPRDPFPHLIAYVIHQDTYRPHAAVESARKVLERLPYLKSVDALESTQQGISSLGSALLGFGLPEWSESYAQESYNPHNAGSHFQSSRRYNTNRGAFVSELVQGLLLDPLAHSQPTRHQDIIRRPRTNLSLSGSWTDSDGGSSQSYSALWQGYRRLPWEISWSLAAQGYDTRGDGTNDASRGATVALGLGVRPGIDDSFSFGFDWYRERSGLPGSPLEPDPDDEMEISDHTLDLGYRHRFGPRNNLLARVAFGRAGRDFTNPSPFGTGLTDIQASFINAGWATDEVRAFFQQGVYDISTALGGPGLSLATDSTNAVATIPGAVLLPRAFPRLVDTDERSREKTTELARVFQVRHLLALGRAHEFTYGAEYIPLRSDVARRLNELRTVNTIDFYEEPILDPEGLAWTFAGVSPTPTSESSRERARFITVYADDRWQPHPRLLLEGGLFFESFRDEFNRDDRLFPRIGAAWEVARGHVLRVGAQRWLDKVTRGTLAPISVAGLLVDNTRSLQGTTLRDYQARLESRWTDRLFTAIGVERTELTDAPRPGYFARDSRRERVTGALNVILAPELAGFARYSHTTAEETGGPLAGSDDPGVPRDAGGVGLAWISPRYIRAVLSHNRVGSQAISYTSAARLDGYWTTDFSITWEPRDKRLLVSLAAGNLFGTDNPAPGRSITLSLQGRF